MPKDDFVLERPDWISDASWEALIDALQLYADEWQDTQYTESEEE